MSKSERRILVVVLCLAIAMYADLIHAALQPVHP